MTTALAFSHVFKRFTVQHDRAQSFQDLMLRMLQRSGGRLPRESYWAVADLNFGIEAGETVAIVGNNGSGKSTSLKLMTRILTPTRGSIDVQGRVSGLLELGAGFHPELSGRDNIYLNGALMGLKKRDIERRFDSIVEFSELERFIDVQLKFYSSGMAMRLAFSIAVSVDADILLVDEVLAVGDQAFQAKCLERIHEIIQDGVTIVFVSHDLDAVRSLCKRAIWLDGGVLRADGVCDDVVDAYAAYAKLEEHAHHVL